MAIEIVDFPIKKMVIFYSYVELPEGSRYGSIENNVNLYMANVMVTDYQTYNV